MKPPGKSSLKYAAILCLSLISLNQASAEPGKSYAAFQETDIASVEPQGWIKEFLLRQKSGLTGHRATLDYPFNTTLWNGEIQVPRDHAHGAKWWPYEQTGYLTDGMLRCGYLLHDDGLIKDGRAGVSYILSHPLPSGRLGFAFFDNQWPLAVFFRALEAEYLATGDQHVIDALHAHFLSYSPAELASLDRNIVNIEGVLWTYGKTGDPKLLELAEASYAAFNSQKPKNYFLSMQMCLAPNNLVMHGVTYMEESKLPAILYMYTGKREYLDASVSAMKRLDRFDMLPDGVPSSNEYLGGKYPLQSHETCDISDYTWSAGYLLEATGDATWADHIEKAVFNAGPGAVSKDFKSFQYFSSVNQVIATGQSNHNNFYHGSTWMAYWPCNEVECCAGNVHRFMPNYVARMWMRTPTGGLVASLYGPSVKTISLDSGNNKLRVTEDTKYPFADTINFTFESTKPVKLPFAFRIPGWCQQPKVTINGAPYAEPLVPGTFVTIDRKFAKGDHIVVTLPMKLEFVKWEAFGVAIQRGPLLFSYAVPEKVAVDSKVYPNLRGKVASNPDFPALDLRPAGPWNYALAVDPDKIESQVRVVENNASGYPFDAGSVPITLKVPARRVNGWDLQENRYTPRLPERGKFTCDPKIETIDMVPYGSTRLRLSVFASTADATVAGASSVQPSKPVAAMAVAPAH